MPHRTTDVLDADLPDASDRPAEPPKKPRSFVDIAYDELQREKDARPEASIEIVDPAASRLKENEPHSLTLTCRTAACA